MFRPFALYGAFWRKAFDFNGRTKRGEYVWTSLIAALPLLIWLALNFQWYLDYVMMQVERGNYFFPLPVGMYIFGAINLIPIISLNCRRLVDAGVDRNWLYAYFVTNIGRSWVTCLVFRPSFDGDQSSLIASKAFQRRYTDNVLLLVSTFFFPLSSLFFGIRRRSMEIALMPIGGANTILKITKVFKFYWGIEINAGIAYLCTGITAATIMYFADKYVKRNSALISSSTN